jgi:hypothetical protein
MGVVPSFLFLNNLQLPFIIPLLCGHVTFFIFIFSFSNQIGMGYMGPKHKRGWAPNNKPKRKKKKILNNADIVSF